MHIMKTDDSTKSQRPSFAVIKPALCSAVMFSLAACSGGGSSTPTTQPPVVDPPTPPAVTVESQTDVAYGSALLQNGTSVDLLLDVYQPDGDCTQSRPFILGIHGGGFIGGSKSSASWVNVMNTIIDRGYVGLSMDYRLAPDEPVISSEFQPVIDDYLNIVANLNLSVDEDILRAAVAAFEDTVTALRWIQDNADDLCIDADTFAIWGSSAGAVTALHVGHGLDEYFINRPDPEVIVDYWGQMFLPQQLDADGPPLMIIHGTADQTVSYDEALALQARAIDIGLSHSFYSIQGGGHGFGVIDPNSVSINGQSALDVTLDFIEDHFLENDPLYETQTIIPN